MAGIDAHSQQRIALQVGVLPIRVRRNAHVANQHKWITMKNEFPYSGALRQCFPHIFEGVATAILLVVANES
ncbi:MAG: hypothetical protein HY028_09690 [Gammaproteobacteria bacterium]|nr:hypothetical protein [Gammaproteobacteria bacterium]